jgi:hypothetical protein
MIFKDALKTTTLVTFMRRLTRDAERKVFLCLASQIPWTRAG